MLQKDIAGALCRVDADTLGKTDPQNRSFLSAKKKEVEEKKSMRSLYSGYTAELTAVTMQPDVPNAKGQ